MMHPVFCEPYGINELTCMILERNPPAGKLIRLHLMRLQFRYIVPLPFFIIKIDITESWRDKMRKRCNSIGFLEFPMGKKKTFKVHPIIAILPLSKHKARIKMGPSLLEKAGFYPIRIMKTIGNNQS